MLTRYHLLLPSLTLTVMMYPVMVNPSNNVYIEHKLENLCRDNNRKVSVNLGKQPAALLFNNTINLQCYLKLRTPQDFGFFVFFDTVRLETASNCSRDFVQFGKDFFFVSSIKSQKFCENFESRDATENSEESSEDENDFDSRIFTELGTNEMDVWIKILAGTSLKQLRMIVTPLMTECDRHNLWWTRCSSGSGCVRRDVVCDGVINCDNDEEQNMCPPRVTSGDADHEHVTQHWFVPTVSIDQSEISILILRAELTNYNSGSNTGLYLRGWSRNIVVLLCSEKRKINSRFLHQHLH